MRELTEEKIKQQYSYYAFISYSRKDEKWAKWLQSRLETYRLPAAIRKDNVDLPQHIAPVFRDKTDLSGIVLDDALHAALDASKYLIVICSPNSAASDYVNKEISYFASLGREKAILPFIIEGEPFSGDENSECFPQALRDMESELLGISVPELGKTNAFLRIVSTLLNLKYDQVVMRDTRRRIRRNTILTAAALVLSVALGITIWHNIPHVKYYNAYVYRNEIPVGIYELSPAERRNASKCYRITTLRGEVMRLECVDPTGQPTDFILESVLTGYPVLEFETDESGRPTSVDQRDTDGHLVSTKVYSYRDSTNEVAIDFQLPGDYHAYAMSADMSYLSIGNSDSSDKSEITRLVNTYDENGLLIRSMFQAGNLDTPASDSNGVYGKLYEHDALGQIIRVTNLDADGNVHNCRYGWATVEYVYDDRGNILQECWFDADGNAARSKDGSYGGVCTYDEHSNLTSFLYIDENGQPYNCSEGYAEARLEYNEDFLIHSTKLFGSHGEPTYGAEGYHEIRCEYDEHHRIICQAFYDADSSPMYLQSYSCASMRVERNDAGQITQLWIYDANGDLTYDTVIGAYGIRYEYDTNGYQCAVYYLDDRGEPTMTKYGYASSHDYNDALGKSQRTEYRDENGNLIRSKENIAIIERTYDTFGNWIATHYYDENGAPCDHIDGFGIEEITYENGNRVSEKYYDSQGNPVISSYGYHECRMEYDGRGNCLRWYHYDTSGNLMEVSGDYAIMEKEYDGYGHVVKERYYDSEGSRASLNGFTEITFEYDARGNCILESYTAAENTSLRYSTVTFEYDEYDNRIREAYYKEDGTLIGGSYFYPSVYLWTYDVQGNKTSERRLDGDGLPLYHDGSMSNTEKYVYDERGNLVLEQHIHAGADGTETINYQYAYAYDSFGNRIRKDQLDADGNLCNETNGDTASYLYTYDTLGNVIRELRYDQDGNPSEPYSCIESEYDAMGNEIVTRFYDSEGNLIDEFTLD